MEGIATGVFEHQRRAVAVAGKLNRKRRPGGIQLGGERVFMFEPLEARERATLCCDQQNRQQSLAGTPIQRHVAVAQRRKCVTRKIPHESFSRRSFAIFGLVHWTWQRRSLFQIGRVLAKAMNGPVER